MPIQQILSFRRSPAVAEPKSPIELLARELVGERGPTPAQLIAFKKAVGWRERAHGPDAKLNFRAQQLLTRHVKSLDAGERATRRAKLRIEDFLPVDEDLKAAHKNAKKALWTAPLVQQQLEEQRARADSAERARDARDRQAHRLSNALAPYFVSFAPPAEQDEGQMPGTVPVPRHARRSTRSLHQRPHSAHILALPTLPTELTSRATAEGSFVGDDDRVSETEGGAHAL